MSTYVLGLNFAYHELSACLIRDGALVAAVEEERFTRIKRGKKALANNPDIIPEQSIQFCLDSAKITMRDVQYIGLSFFPDDRLKNINADPYFIEGDWGSEKARSCLIQKYDAFPNS